MPLPTSPVCLCIVAYAVLPWLYTTLVYMYRIARNFRLLYVYFATKLEWCKINQQKILHVFCEHCGGEVWLAAMALLHFMTVFLWRNAEIPDPAVPLSPSLPLMAIEQANVAITRSQVLRQWKCPKHQHIAQCCCNRFVETFSGENFLLYSIHVCMSCM